MTQNEGSDVNQMLLWRRLRNLYEAGLLALLTNKNRAEGIAALQRVATLMKRVATRQDAVEVWAQFVKYCELVGSKELKLDGRAVEIFQEAARYLRSSHGADSTDGEALRPLQNLLSQADFMFHPEPLQRPGESFSERTLAEIFAAWQTNQAVPEAASALRDALVTQQTVLNPESQQLLTELAWAFENVFDQLIDGNIGVSRTLIARTAEAIEQLEVKGSKSPERGWTVYAEETSRDIAEVEDDRIARIEALIEDADLLASGGVLGESGWTFEDFEAEASEPAIATQVDSSELLSKQAQLLARLVALLGDNPKALQIVREALDLNQQLRF
tara:strand:+ start:4564 stop:5553 length:990 start_codon:yes stop_codon:yes gene_type:complete